MKKKSFILSSAGLKNLVQNQSYGDDFKFIFGEHEIQMKNLFAEFISPYVSQIHQSDPTINSIHFCNINTTNQSAINYLSEMREVFPLFESISKGESIEIDYKQCIQLQIISILLENEEMLIKLNELFENEEEEYSEMKIIKELEFVSFLEMNSKASELWNLSKSIEYIASNLYLIDSDQIIGLSRSAFYSILTNDKLVIESEDSLLDLIEKFTNNEETQKSDFSSESSLSDVDFYEEANFDFLSEDKLREFIEKVDMNEMTAFLWSKIKKCFYVYMKEQAKPPISGQRDGNGFYHRIQKCAKSIVVGGWDANYRLGENPNSKNKYGEQIIHPPVNSSLDPSSLLSYSHYYCHTVAVTRSGSLIGVGYNRDGRITSSLPKTDISQFKEFSVNDGNGRPLAPVSAVCTAGSTLYMFTKSRGSGRQLVFCDCSINGGTPVFLDIGSHEPVSLFGGYLHSASICADGEVIFINRNSVINSPSSQIPSSSLPGGEKATMVACLDHSVFALSSSGRVFVSAVESGSCALKFSAVSELSGIVWLSGTYEHCLAVSREGRVFVRGSNTYGRLGLGKETSSVSSFTEISSLSGHKIRAAYAGLCHSLFETYEGKILACGFNEYGELLLSSGPSDEYVYFPTETTIKEGATFAVAGRYTSSVFFGGDPPPNTPNTRVKHYEIFD